MKIKQLILTTILCFSLSISLVAQTSTTERSVADFLDENGHFHNPEGFSGNLDVTGFELTKSSDGTPVFKNADTDHPDNEYWDLESSLYGANAEVIVMIVHNDHLYVGGNFTVIGDKPIRMIARYDLTDGSWHSLGDGLSGSVLALAINGNDLYVGGVFNEASVGSPPNRIARFDMVEESWHPLGDGVNGESFVSVRALEVYEDNLFVAGRFTEAGGEPASNIARYDLNTETWHSMGEGLHHDSLPMVEALAAGNGNLFLGGQFTEAGGVSVSNIARYNISEESWHEMGEGVNSSVQALKIIDNDLIIGGSFTEAGGESVNSAARYNTIEGSWHALGGGVHNGGITDFLKHGDNLYVVGFFNSVGEQWDWAGRIARYDLNNDSWHYLWGADGFNSAVRSIVMQDDQLYVGGDFTMVNYDYDNLVMRMASINPDNGDVRPLFNGTGLALDRPVRALTNSGERVHLGGEFTMAGYYSHTGISTFNSSGDYFEWWETTIGGSVWAIAESQNDLFAGGFFTFAGNDPVSNIARYSYNDGMWHNMGEGINSIVRVITVHEDNLYVGGFFTQAGGEPANSIVRYNISDGSWHTLGEGVNSTVWALVVKGDDLYVGGAFTQAGGQPASRIARYNLSEESWHALGEGLDATVVALAVKGDDLIAGGTFTEADGEPANYIVRYEPNTGSWHNMGDGTNDMVLALSVHGNDIYAGGAFTEAGGESANHIARYDTGSGTWHALGDGLNNYVWALTVADGDLYAGGDFLQAGGKPATYFARWSNLEVTSISDPDEFPMSLELAQNYPNPFNPSTVISYQLPVQSDVTLEVFDILGRRVAVLDNGMRSAGRHEVNFDASDLSSGMYIYRIIAGEFMETRTMMLVK